MDSNSKHEGNSMRKSTSKGSDSGKYPRESRNDETRVPPSAEQDSTKIIKGSDEANVKKDARDRKSFSPVRKDTSRASATSITSTKVNRSSPASLSPVNRSPPHSPAGTEPAGQEHHEHVLPDMLKDSRMKASIGPVSSRSLEIGSQDAHHFGIDRLAIPRSYLAVGQTW